MRWDSRRLSASYRVPGASRTLANDSMSLVSAYPCFGPSARLDRIKLAGPEDLPSVSSAPTASACARPVPAEAGDSAGLARPGVLAAAVALGSSDVLMCGILYRLPIDR